MAIVAAKGVAVFFLLCAAARAASAGDGPLLNGNFEYPPDKSQMNGSRVMWEYAIPYWKIFGYVEYIESGQQQGDMILPVPEGAHAVRLGNEACIRQQLSVERGAYYSVTFSAARTCAQAERLRVSVDPGGDAPGGDDLPIQTLYSSNGWDSYSWAFLARSGVVSLIIHNPGQEDDPACGPIIDSVAIKTLYPPQATPNNLLKNGDFEEGPYVAPESSSGVMVPPMDEDDVSPLPGWMIMSYSKSVKYVYSAHFAVPQGAHAVELVSGAETALVQEVDTAPGSACRLEFSVGDAGDGCVAYDPPLRVQASTASGSTVVSYYSQGGGGSTRGALDFTATDARTRVVLFSLGYHTKSDGGGTLCGPVVDDVSLACAAASQPPPARRLLR